MHRNENKNDVTSKRGGGGGGGVSGTPSAVAGYILVDDFDGWYKYDANWQNEAFRAEADKAAKTAVVDVANNWCFGCDRDGSGIYRWRWDPYGNDFARIVDPLPGGWGLPVLYEPDQRLFVGDAEDRIREYEYDGTFVQEWTANDPWRGNHMESVLIGGEVWIYFMEREHKVARLNVDTGTKEVIASPIATQDSGAVSIDHVNQRIAYQPDESGTTSDPIYTMDFEGNDVQKIYGAVDNAAGIIATDCVNGLHLFEKNGNVWGIPLLGGAAAEVFNPSYTFGGITVVYEPWR